MSVTECTCWTCVRQAGVLMNCFVERISKSFLLSFFFSSSSDMMAGQKKKERKRWINTFFFLYTSLGLGVECAPYLKDYPFILSSSSYYFIPSLPPSPSVHVIYIWLSPFFFFMIILCVCTVLEFYWLGQHTFSHFLLQDVLFSRGSTGV